VASAESGGLFEFLCAAAYSDEDGEAAELLDKKQFTSLQVNKFASWQVSSLESKV